MKVKISNNEFCQLIICFWLSNSALIFAKIWEVSASFSFKLFSSSKRMSRSVFLLLR